jgi:oxepin-CoA hydrolase/3-oxo-5,6-dehydrosuberyl-CoA semialdehyde dehydrogenase
MAIPDAFDVDGADPGPGPSCRRCSTIAQSPTAAARIHDTEAFGPVATVMGYTGLDHAAHLANRGGGSLVVSLVTSRSQLSRETVTMESAAFHGRIYINNRTRWPRAPAMAPPCRIWSMAGRAARAAARNWAACGGSCTTCNGPPCRAARTC